MFRVTDIQKQVFEKAKNDVIDGILHYFGKETIGHKGDMRLNELKWSSTTELISEENQEMIMQKIWNPTEEKINEKSLNIIKCFLLPRVISKIVPTKEKREYLKPYEDEQETREEYAEFLHKGFTEYLSLEYANASQLPYEVAENHKENHKFAQEVVQEMKKLPTEFSSQIRISLFAYNIDQIEMQLSSLTSKKDFYKEFKTKYLYKAKLEKIKGIIQEDFDEEKQLKILGEIQKNKTSEYAGETLKEAYLKNGIPQAEEKIRRIKEILTSSNTSTSQSKSNGNTRVLAKTGSIKGLFIFVFSILFALIIAYFMAK